MQPVIPEFYPPNPTNVPPLLTRPSGRYRLRALLVAISLAFFLLLYLLFIVVFAGLSVVCFSAVINGHNFHARGGFVATMLIVGASFLGFSSGLLALYLIKGLFKFPRGDDHNGIEITEAEQPQLFAFIRRICADTGAPAPAKIVVSPEVNASVFYKCTFWSLFFPVRKNLHIGLGLVNCLNLSEFKAVLAHEFGHFSQRSMRLGGFVYSTNRIIQEIIYGRDWLDDMLSAVDPVLRALRWLLGKILRGINFADASLSRQMEFQADLVAVSVSGSDAIVHGLLRTDFAYQCLDQTWKDLMAAGDHGLRTNDLFFHQSKTVEYLRILKDEPSLGIPPAEPGAGVQVFAPNETTLPPMWASHPPHFERERNCKRTYLPAPQDERPAWTVFANPDDLRQRMTRRHYEFAKPAQPLEPRPAEVVQKFIDDDRAETIYSARYHGMYEEGLISPGEIDKLQKLIPARWDPPAKMLREHADIFGPELKDRLNVYRERCKDQQRLLRFANKVEIPKGGMFEFRGTKHRTADAPLLLETLENELHGDHEYLSSIDRRIFLVYMGMAGQLDSKSIVELEHRYRFHLAVQDMVISLTYWNRQIQDAFAALSATRDASPEAIQAVSQALRQAQDAMGSHISLAASLRLPAFKNMRAGDPLSFFLDAKPVVHDLFGSEQIVDGTWINQILTRHAEVIDKLRRILFKSLGSLLCFQERVGELWKARYATAPVRDLGLRPTAPTPALQLAGAANSR